MKTIIVILSLLVSGSLSAQEWIELRLSYSVGKATVLVVNDDKPYDLKEDGGKKVVNMPRAIEVMQEKGWGYVTTYSMIIDLQMGVAITYICTLMKKDSEPTNPKISEPKKSTENIPVP